MGTLARLTLAGSVSSKRSSLSRSLTPSSSQTGPASPADSGQAENLAQDMADLMHDFDAVSRWAQQCFLKTFLEIKGKFCYNICAVFKPAFNCRINSLIGTLKCPYPGLTTDTTAEILAQIQSSIRQKVRFTNSSR